MERGALLREALVAELAQSGIVRSAQLAGALRKVPRHRFLPETPVDDAYADRAIAIKTEGETVVSSISQPAMVAQMLELLAPAPGDRILEIGTGSGYNAALLSELAGPMGSVTTIELDSELATRARALLRDECGYPNVRVVVGDGSAGVDAATGFDGIVVTARCDDVAAAWWDALREGGRIVLPLQLGDDGEYAVGFARRGARLESIGISPCAFIALRGEASAAGKGSAEAFYRSGVKTAGGKTRKALESVVAVRKRDAKPELLAQADVVLARHVSLFAIRYA